MGRFMLTSTEIRCRKPVLRFLEYDAGKGYQCLDLTKAVTGSRTLLLLSLFCHTMCHVLSMFKSVYQKRKLEKEDGE